MNFIVKNTTHVGLLDLLAPHSCRGCGRLGEVLCARCKKYILEKASAFCPNCKTKTSSHVCPKCSDLPPIYFIGERVGLLDDIIHAFKYDSIRALGPILAEFLDAKLPSTLPFSTFIVPLPTAFHHIRARGFDHTLCIAKHLAKIRHYEISKLLVRNSNTTQVGSSRSARLVQAEQAFKVNPLIKINPNATYLLLDDVWTTGASMKAAVKKLQQAGVSRIVVALLAVSRLD